MTELKIKWNYGRGQMQIDIDQFLSMRNIAKVRKLLKIIRESDTPGQEDIFKERIEQLLLAVAGAKKSYANKAVDWGTAATERKQELPKIQSELERVTAYRNDYKKNSLPWKTLNEQVKEVKERLKDQKAKVRNAEDWKRDYTNQLKSVQRNEVFYKKLLSEVFS